jgi:hypothetical protein
MKYAILLLLLSGCATTPEPTLVSMIRSGYLFGCLDEGGMVAINETERKALETRCEIKELNFDPHNVGVYRDDLEVHRVKINPLDNKR